MAFAVLYGGFAVIAGLSALALAALGAAGWCVGAAVAAALCGCCAADCLARWRKHNRGGFP